MSNVKFDRFDNYEDRDFELFKKAVPHHDVLQQKVGKIVKDFSERKSGDKINVVEAGPGTGFTTMELLRADDRIHVFAVDTNKELLESTKERTLDFKERVEYIHQDILSFLKKGLANNFDAFASAFTVHNLPKKHRKKLFPEIYRTLKEGGLFVNADKYARNDNERHKKDLTEQLDAFNVFVELGNPELKKKTTEHYLADDEINITEGEQIKILKDLGFTEVSVEYRERMEAVIRAIK